MSGRPLAVVRVTRTHIDVVCRFTGTRLPLVDGGDQRDLITKAVFAHERHCGRDRCDTGPAYTQGDPAFDGNLRAAAHYTLDRVELARASARQDE